MFVFPIQVTIKLNCDTINVKTLQDVVLKEKFGMISPDVEIEDGKGET